MEWTIDTGILIKLILSSGLGAAIGLERELKRKPAGLKTSIVISIISCLLTIVSVESVYLYHKNSDINITMDPLRLAAQIVSGVGFLGAGVILHKANDSISGLTTAAMVWGSAGIGIVVGAGFYSAAITGVIMLLLAVEIVPVFIRRAGPQRLQEKILFIKIRTSNYQKVQEIIKAVEQKDLSIKKIHIVFEEETKNHQIHLTAGVYFKRKTTEVYYTISEIPDVRYVDIEGP